MKYIIRMVALTAVWIGLATSAHAQGPANENDVTEPPAPVAGESRDSVEEIGKQVDENKTAQEASAGILKSIYVVAEYLSFSAFHWLAFAIMVTGVVSFALQLVLAKLLLLTKGSFSLTEMLSDALGLVISLLGLVLTTQAATENSRFTSSPAAVLSATAIGLLVGIVFYWWGQSQEVQAARGRRKQP